MKSGSFLLFSHDSAIIISISFDILWFDCCLKISFRHYYAYVGENIYLYEEIKDDKKGRKSGKCVENLFKQRKICV